VADRLPEQPLVEGDHPGPVQDRHQRRTVTGQVTENAQRRERLRRDRQLRVPTRCERAEPGQTVEQGPACLQDQLPVEVSRDEQVAVLVEAAVELVRVGRRVVGPPQWSHRRR